MRYFANITTIAELKAEYRKLAMINHPDHGGSTALMQALNEEFDTMYHTLSIMRPSCEKSSTESSAYDFRREFYTQNGWAGKNYEIGRTTKEITKILRNGIKQMYPLTKWSVSFSSYSGGSTIHVRLMEAPYNVFAKGAEVRDGYYSVNEYHLEREENLTEQALDMFKKVNELIKSYHFSDCDGMIDYFNVNFWYDLTIGRWDKPFQVVPKTDRVGTQANPKDKAVSVKDGDTGSKSAYNFDVSPDVDTRDNSQLFVVKCKTPLDHDEYTKLAACMRKLGAYYSRYKHGFIFREDPGEKIKEIMA